MADPLLLKLEQRDRLSPEERQVLQRAVTRVREYGADEDIVREGDRPAASSLLLEGFAARYKVLSNGKRQITALHVTGDFVDLHSFLLHTMDHGIVALSPCRVAIVPHETLREITERYPHLGRLLLLNTLIDGATHREWLVAMGRRPAIAHTAHLLCELFTRLRVVGQTNDRSFNLPITQAEFGDALGLSTVHVNRVLQELRAKRLITWDDGLVTIHDWERLQHIAEFDPTYLNLQNEAR